MELVAGRRTLSGEILRLALGDGGRPSIADRWPLARYSCVWKRLLRFVLPLLVLHPPRFLGFRRLRWWWRGR